MDIFKSLSSDAHTKSQVLQLPNTFRTHEIQIRKYL